MNEWVGGRVNAFNASPYLPYAVEGHNNGGLPGHCLLLHVHMGHVQKSAGANAAAGSLQGVLAAFGRDGFAQDQAGVAVDVVVGVAVEYGGGLCGLGFGGGGVRCAIEHKQNPGRWMGGWVDRRDALAMYCERTLG